MVALAVVLLFAFAFMLAVGVIAATVQPEYDRIVRLLRHGPMIGAVEMAGVREMRSRRVTARRVPAVRTTWREAA